MLSPKLLSDSALNAMTSNDRRMKRESSEHPADLEPTLCGLNEFFNRTMPIEQELRSP